MSGRSRGITPASGKTSPRRRRESAACSIRSAVPAGRPMSQGSAEAFLRRCWPGVRRSSDSLGSKIALPLDWDEALEAPYFTGRPGWDGFGSLVLWAAYAEHPALRRPATLPEEWDNDPALMRSNVAGFRSRYSHLVRNVELWLPSPFEFTFEGEDIDGRRVVVGSTTTLRPPARRSERGDLEGRRRHRGGMGPRAAGRGGAARTLRALCLCGPARPRPAGGRAQTADEARLLTQKPLPAGAGRGCDERALSGGRCGRRRLGGGRAIAPLVHELVELGAVLGGAQPVEEVAELALLLVELAQRLLAIFVEGDVAAAL